MLKLTVGVATYRRKQLLQETVFSILASAERVRARLDIEVLIGNDDVSGALILADLALSTSSGVRIINHPINLGEVANMNALLSAATGDWFTWLGDDDLWSGSILERFLDAQKYGVDVVYPGYGWIYKSLGGVEQLPSSEPKDLEPKLLTSDIALERFLNGSLPVIGVYGFFKLSTLRDHIAMEALSPGSKIGVFSEYLVFMKALRAGKIAYLPEPLVWYRAHSESWGVNNQSVDVYRNAGPRLVARVGELFTGQGLVQRTTAERALEWSREQSMYYWLSKASGCGDRTQLSESNFEELCRALQVTEPFKLKAHRAFKSARRRQSFPAWVKSLAFAWNESRRRRARKYQNYQQDFQ